MKSKKRARKQKNKIKQKKQTNKSYYANSDQKAPCNSTAQK